MIPYQCILADPGWEYDDKLRQSTVKRSSTDQYRTMSVQEICDLYTLQRNEVVGDGRRARHVVIPGRFCGMFPVADIALLGLWITPPFLLDGIHMRVCNAWGFTPRQIVPWIKGRLMVDHAMLPTPTAKLVIQPGMGHLTRGCVEYLILATRGKYTQLVQTHSENGLLLAEQEAFIVAPKSKHSRKPTAAYALMEKLFPGPRLELFARERREGWDAWGNELPIAEAAAAPAYDAAPPDDVEIIEWP